MPRPLSLLTLALCAFFTILSASPLRAVEVNCHDGSSLNGIDGFDVQVACNPLADKIMIHRTFIEDYVRKYLSSSGLEITEDINPESGMVGITVTSVEWLIKGEPAGYATSLNININRAALCLLGDDEFHAIASIVRQDDRLIVSDRERSRDFILDILKGSLDKLIEDLETADPVKYTAAASRGSAFADSGD